MRPMHPSPRHSLGLNLVELLVALALSVLLLAGVGTMFASSRSTYESNDRLARIEESGRFGLDMIARDLRGAGYIGCNKLSQRHNVLNNGATVGGLWNFSEGIQAFDAQTSTWIPTLDTAKAPLPTAGSDVLILHVPRPANPTLKLRAAMVTPTDPVPVPTFPSGNPGPFINNQILMISNCESSTIFEISNYNAQTGTIDHIADTDGTATSPGNSSGSLNYPYTADSQLVAVQTVVYYVRDLNGTPALYRRIDNADPQPLVENVEMMQVRVGYDSNSDRSADDNVVPSAATTSNTIVSVTISLLVRSPETYGAPVSKTYKVIDVSAARNDAYMRKVFTTTALVRNTAL